MQALPPPKSLLGRHRLLAPNASVYVSPICLGGMSIGNNWSQAFGSFTQSDANALLDYFYDQGGNFIDTANAYQSGQSEEWIGEWMQKRGVRDEMVIATKYTHNWRVGAPNAPHIMSNFGGTGSKSLAISVENSLRKLRVEYIDILYVHNWDFATGVEELMQSLNTLVSTRKVLYLGISDAPAWLVVKANAYARQHGLRPFSIYQGRWSAQVRDFEREIIPMARSEGMALHPWGVLGNGYLRAPSSDPKASGAGRNTPFLVTGREERVSSVLAAVAERHSVPLTSIAIAYVMHKAPYVFPVLGGRSITNLAANIAALGLRLSATDLEEIESAYDFDLGFPHNFINQRNYMVQGPEDCPFTVESLGYLDHVRAPQPIPPHTGELGVRYTSRDVRE